MNTCRRFAWCLLSLSIVFTAGVLLGAKAKPSGADPYTPTKREWLAVEINSFLSREWSKDSPFMMFAAPGRDENEITAAVVFMPEDKEAIDVHRKSAESALRNFRDHIEKAGEARGWDDWLVVRERFKESIPVTQ
jgi:hypothetical protein